MTDKAFWKGLGDRALKTFLQTFIAVLGVQTGITITLDGAKSLPWLTALITATFAAALSAYTSYNNRELVSAPYKPYPGTPALDANAQG